MTFGGGARVRQEHGTMRAVDKQINQYNTNAQQNGQKPPGEVEAMARAQT